MIRFTKYNILAEKLKEELDIPRYQHSLEVAYVASQLAEIHGEVKDKAFRAGLLHDCAKCIPIEVQLALCEMYGIEVSDFDKRSSAVLHAKVGAKLAEDLYSEQDADVLDAIRYHTTGRPGMSLLEKIIFVADYVEPGRDKAPDLPMIRSLVLTDLDAAVIKILHDTLLYLQSSGKDTDPATRETYEYYIANK